MLADGFYEWQGTGGTKRPMRIVMQSGEPFAFAGLWSVWRDPDWQPHPFMRHHSRRQRTNCSGRSMAGCRSSCPRDMEGLWLDPSINGPWRAW